MDGASDGVFTEFQVASCKRAREVMRESSVFYEVTNADLATICTWQVLVTNKHISQLLAPLTWSTLDVAANLACDRAAL